LYCGAVGLAFVSPWSRSPPASCPSPYCAFTPSGGRRGAAYSARWYKRAFQRIYILMHGGTAEAMTARLRALGLARGPDRDPGQPKPQHDRHLEPARGRRAGRLRKPLPQLFPGLEVRRAYGNNYYNTSAVYAYHRTEGLYRAYPGKPFMFPEWGLTVDDPAYVKAFATFIRRHPRVRFVSFFNAPAGGPSDLGTKPRSRAAYRRFVTPLSD
jgi:hypothetical protein